MSAVNLIKLTTTFIVQSTVNYHYVSLLLSVRATKTGPSIVLRLNYVNVHQSTNLTKFTITFIAQSIVKDYKKK